jgi:mono/diheme cytochrome c family protein
MTRRTIISLALSAALAAASSALAKPLTYVLPNETAAFRPGPGVNVAQYKCASCHSADYINSQPPNKGSAFWEAEVQKMIKAYHAQIDENEAKSIADYLSKTY